MKINHRKALLTMTVILALLLALQFVFRAKALTQSWAEAMFKSEKYQLADKVHSRNASAQDDIAKANLAKSRYKLGRYQEAESPANEALQAQPESPDRNYDLGNIYYRKGDYQNALEHYRKAMLQNPKDHDAKANYELAMRKLQQQPPQPKPDDKKQQDQQKQEDIRNILGGLDSKESSDRKSNQAQGEAGDDKWW